MGEEDNKGGEDGIKIGEETYTPEQIVAVFEENKNLKAGSESVAPVAEFTAKHGISPAQLVEQSEQAFTVLNGLIEEGYIDSEGKPLIPKQKASDTLVPPKSEGDKNKMSGLTLEKVKDLVQESLKPYQEEITALKGDNAKLITHALQVSIANQYPDATSKQIAQAIALGNRDPSKKIFQHVESVMTQSASEAEAAEKAWAEKYGLDLNKLREQTQEVTPQTVIGKSKISFKKGEGKITPQEAVRKYFQGKGLER